MREIDMIVIRSMAKLIWELSARFQKAQTLGHRDLPGVHKACPCYDVAKDQNGEEPFQSLKTLPRIRDRPMHRVQKPDPKRTDIYAQGQRPDSDLGEGYARGAETCLRFRAELCTGCRMFSQI